MKRNLLLAFVVLATGIAGHAQQGNAAARQIVQLPNGWKLSPAGRSLPLGDLPLNIAVSRTGKYLAVTNNGQSTQSIQLINPASETILDNITIPKSWGGICFSADEQYLYASGGNDNWILKYAIRRQKLITADTFKLGDPWPNKISPAGITMDDRRQLLYVVTKEDNSLYVVDMAAKKIINRLPLSGEAYTCLLSPDRKELYVSVWGADKIMVYNTGRRIFTDSIPVGDNPNDMCLSAGGKYLYVANANDNSVLVIDIRNRKPVETLNAALYPGALTGSTTNGVALTADGKTLYVANADNNCVAVFDVSRPGFSKSKGFIPAGWYPTCVRVTGRKIFVSNGKGFSSLPNPDGPNPTLRREEVALHEGIVNKPVKLQYIAGLFMGTMSIVDMPDEKQMSNYSRAVYQNTPYSKAGETDAGGEEGNPIPRRVGDRSPIKHVIYIIKENRTYDQVLGDVAEGNGDKNLVLFGEKITPNQHALVKEFVLLDNFYVDGEVSSDGHNWCMGAYATDFLEKNWPTSYGRRGGSEASSGYRAVANNQNGFLWDQAKKYGVSYRTYGEFTNNYQPNIPSLKGHMCPYFPSFNFDIRDTSRALMWQHEFDSLLNAGALPRLSTIRLPNDHTEGTTPGRPTPFVHVADNDLAVGMIIAHLSKSPVWKETVVFILEDDAQNGPDHVDAHRSPVYIAGGLVKKGYVDHTLYSTSSVVRTIELILGLPPMSQYDAAATPMWRCFNKTPDHEAFTARPVGVDLNEKNIKNNPLAQLSARLDFSKEDIIPDAILNEIIWKCVKGDNAVLPGPTRAAFYRSTKKADADD